MRPYTYDDYPNDFDLNNFTLSNEDIKWKIPFVQNGIIFYVFIQRNIKYFLIEKKIFNKIAMRISKKTLKMFASAWTAPPWMKTNNDYKGNGLSSIILIK